MSWLAPRTGPQIETITRTPMPHSRQKQFTGQCPPTPTISGRFWVFKSPTGGTWDTERRLVSDGRARADSRKLNWPAQSSRVAAGHCVSWWLVSGQVGRDTNQTVEWMEGRNMSRSLISGWRRVRLRTGPAATDRNECIKALSRLGLISELISR